MKKIISLILLATMSVTILSGCGKSAGSSTSTSSTETQKGVTLTVLTNRTDIVNTDLKKFGDEYKTKTGVTIKWDAIDEYSIEMKTRLKSLNYGDVLLIPNDMQNSQLPDFFEPLGINTDSKLKDYYYADFKALRNANGSMTTYGLSYGMGGDGVVYNKAAFKKAGIEKFPTTLTGLYDAASKLKAGGIVPLATDFKDKWPLTCYDSIAILTSGNGSYYNNIYKETSPFSPDKPHGKSFAILYKFLSNHWVENDMTITTWDQSTTDLATGKTGMMFLGAWAIAEMQKKATNKDDIGFAAMPVDDSGKPNAIVSPTWNLAVSKYSSNKKEATDFLFAFINSDYSSNNGFLPINKNIESSNPVLKEFMVGTKFLVTAPLINGNEDIKKDNIANRSEIDLYAGKYIQDVVTAAQTSKGEFDQQLETLNAKWAKAKKELNY